MEKKKIVIQMMMFLKNLKINQKIPKKKVAKVKTKINL